jgi:hypothetical protein
VDYTVLDAPKDKLHGPVHAQLFAEDAHIGFEAAKSHSQVAGCTLAIRHCKRSQDVYLTLTETVGACENLTGLNVAKCDELLRYTLTAQSLIAPVHG